MADTSIEGTIIEKCAAELETALKSLDRDLVHFLRKEGFLTAQIRDSILSPTSTLTDEEKAGELVRWIRHRVKQDPASFHTLVAKLECSTDREHFQPIVKLLKNEYASFTYLQQSTEQTYRSRGLSKDSAFGSTSSSFASPNMTSPTSESPVFDELKPPFSKRFKFNEKQLQVDVESGNEILGTVVEEATVPDSPETDSIAKRTTALSSSQTTSNGELLPENGHQVSPGPSHEKQCSTPAILEYTKSVKNVRAFGLFLEIDPGRLDEMEIPNRRIEILQQWFNQKDMDDACRWKELVRVLQQPAIGELGIAESIRKAMSCDESEFISIPSQPLSHHEIEKIGRKTEECSITNVLNCIEPYDWYKLGLFGLKLPKSKLEEIKTYPEYDRKAHLVELWHRLDPSNFTWTRLQQALMDLTGRKKLKKFKHDIIVERDPHIVREEIKDLEEKFKSLVKDFRRYLDSEKREVEDIKDTLMSLPQNLHVIYSPILDSMLSSLGKCENFWTFFLKLNDCWNFIDYDLLKSFIEEHGSADLKTAMNAYLEELNKFCQSTTVHQLVTILNPKYHSSYSAASREEDRNLFISTLDRDARAYTIQELDYFRREASDFVRPLLTSAMILYDIMPGSITLLWLIAEKDVELFSSSIHDHVKMHQNAEFIHKHGIIFLGFNDYILYPIEEHFWNACREGTVQKARELLENSKADPNQTCEALGMNVLMCAAKHGLSDICGLLIKFQATACLQVNGESVLSLSKPHDSLHQKLMTACEAEMIKAAEENNLVVLENAVEIGVDINAKEKDDYGWTALLWACDSSHVGVVDYLLEHGADANAEDSEGWTGLILASRRGHLDIMKKLLDKGADIQKLTKVKWGALMWAAQEGHTHVVKFLLERGVDATVQDEHGFTPFHQACQDGHLGVVKALVEHDPDMDMDQTNNNDWPAIMMATKNGHEDIVRYLVDHGSDVYYQKQDKVTSLHIAAYKGYNSIVRYFCLSKKLKVDTQDRDGITPLMYAAKERKLDVVRTLVENGRADVNITEKDNSWTALFFAVEAREHNIVDYLLRSERVDVTHVDEIGNNVVDLARFIYPKALDLLSKYHKEKTEVMTSVPPKMVTMKPYQHMLDKMGSRMESTVHGPEIKVA